MKKEKCMHGKPIDSKCSGCKSAMKCLVDSASKIRMEAFVERWADENIKNGKFLCGCGYWFDLKDAETLSANPYSLPVCPDCCEKYCKGLEKEKNES